MITQSVGRALDREAALADRAQPQRIVERERMRDAGLVELRRDHPDVVRQRAADLGADVEPLGMDAVVVGDQDAHIACLDYLPCSIVLSPPI